MTCRACPISITSSWNRCASIRPHGRSIALPASRSSWAAISSPPGRGRSFHSGSFTTCQRFGRPRELPPRALDAGVSSEPAAWRVFPLRHGAAHLHRYAAGGDGDAARTGDYPPTLHPACTPQLARPAFRAHHATPEAWSARAAGASGPARVSPITGSGADPVHIGPTRPRSSRLSTCVTYATLHRETSGWSCGDV